ncbi:MAG: CHAT domain-containing protein, partial [Microcystaceae cyanobacterium]
MSNLSLVYKQLGKWTEANQAISTSLEILQPSDAQEISASRLRILAQVLDIQGQIQLNQGQSQQALATWERASATFAQIGEENGVTRSRINQAQALQALGLYR